METKDIMERDLKIIYHCYNQTTSPTSDIRRADKGWRRISKELLNPESDLAKQIERDTKYLDNLKSKES